MSSLWLSHDWFGRSLPPNVSIGDRSWLHSAYVFLHYRSQRPCGLRVGNNTGIYIDTFFDLGPCGEVEIGDYCTIAGAIIATNNRVTIGNYVLISREVVIADTFAATPAQPSEPLTSIAIGNDVWIGMRAVLLQGAWIGDGAIVGAGAVVDFTVPANAIVAGNPARIVGSSKGGRRCSVRAT
ncbi:acyltransferase [Chlorogloeopsis sp. ULAP01]|uniref:acyltransferase n=1 Tax=Chlorogloeopsis sp. ULAP01 TaxID=3056483 RepID=UPI0025AAE9F0|nr:acyltransferase [Chlorogloeopsis sp. ULAP01]MDM9379812.1 acyltransferase [Chlorogloeopsis sp. ULAP01]